MAAILSKTIWNLDKNFWFSKSLNHSCSYSSTLWNWPFEIDHLKFDLKNVRILNDHFFRSPLGSEYQTCSVFKWIIAVWMSNLIYILNCPKTASMTRQTIQDPNSWLVDIHIFVQVFCTSLNGNTQGTKYRLSGDKSNTSQHFGYALGFKG